MSVFVWSLGLTLCFELAFALLWGVRGRDLLLIALANGVTNPAVVLLHTLFPSPVVTATLELSAVLVEGLLYRQFAPSLRRPMFFSLLANALSFSLGLLVNLFL